MINKGSNEMELNKKSDQSEGNIPVYQLEVF